MPSEIRLGTLGSELSKAEALGKSDNPPSSQASRPPSGRCPGFSRGSFYYQPKPVNSRNQTLMNRIDHPQLELLVADTRMLRDLLRQGGDEVSIKPVSMSVKRVGIEVLCRNSTTVESHTAAGLIRALTGKLGSVLLCPWLVATTHDGFTNGK